MKNKDRDLLESAYDDIAQPDDRPRKTAIDRVECLCKECIYNDTIVSEAGKMHVCTAASIQLNTIQTEDYGPVCICETFEVG